MTVTVVLPAGGTTVVFADTPAAAVSCDELAARDLKALGLFKGVSETDFALDRAPTRLEAVTMLIRMLGKEKEALTGSWHHPFTDVPSWADSYVGYAYEKGLTNGVSANSFGTGDASSAMYLTFVLRALGWSDLGGTDFSWDAPYSLAKAAGLLPESVDTHHFLRGDVALVSYAGLSAKLKGSTHMLSDRLIEQGVFSRELFSAVYDSSRTSGIRLPRSVTGSAYSFRLSDVPAFSGTASCELNGNVPVFSSALFFREEFESYAPLDSLGRCGAAFALIGLSLMPTEERGSIGMIRPTGFRTDRYDDLIATRYLYNRCHLIAYQLTGENDNERNLITGTYYLNISGMQPYENRVAGYIRSTGNHVLYRATPIFAGQELVARGVHLEACSVEDAGQGVMFNVFVYNEQPGVIIDHATGENRRDENYMPAGGSADPGGESSLDDKNEITDSRIPAGLTESAPEDAGYVLNLRSLIFHYPDCKSVSNMSETNKFFTGADRDTLLTCGCSPCGVCHP